MLAVVAVVAVMAVVTATETGMTLTTGIYHR